MKSIFKSFIIAFSMYSKIPMPRTEWKEEDMRYVFVFFPLVGIIVGLIFYVWNYISILVELPELLRICLSLAIPILITGGIHIDGYMDTMDAIHSYRDKETKLSILKDPHIGAFSVIMLVLYILITGGCMALVKDTTALMVLAFGFILSRILSALAAVTFKSAREGTLRTFSGSSSVIVVRVMLVIELLALVCGIMVIDWRYALAVVTGGLITFIYYYFKTRKEFGGITGDTAGYFLCLSEGAMIVLVGLMEYMLIDMPQLI